MLGSVSDAEDAVQETYLNAWRSIETFEGRASMRTWLYRIATRACLKAIEGSGRRPLPSGLGEQFGIAWLEPYPDPADVVESRQGLRLALIAALQHLPPRQRAVLILRDVLAWRAAEVAEVLETTTAAVNSALQRARAQLAVVEPDSLLEPDDPRLREILDLYAAAFANADVQALVRLMTKDAIWEMPPLPQWFRGREDIGRFLETRLTVPFRLEPITANGQPGFVVFRYGERHALQVLEVTASGISRIVHFLGGDQGQ